MTPGRHNLPKTMSNAEPVPKWSQNRIPSNPRNVSPGEWLKPPVGGSSHQNICVIYVYMNHMCRHVSHIYIYMYIYLPIDIYIYRDIYIYTYMYIGKYINITCLFIIYNKCIVLNVKYMLLTYYRTQISENDV